MKTNNMTLPRGEDSDPEALLLAKVYKLILSWDIPQLEHSNIEEPPAATGGKGKTNDGNEIEVICHE